MNFHSKANENIGSQALLHWIFIATSGFFICGKKYESLSRNGMNIQWSKGDNCNWEKKNNGAGWKSKPKGNKSLKGYVLSQIYYMKCIRSSCDEMFLVIQPFLSGIPEIEV